MPPANSRTSARQKRHSRLRLRVAGYAQVIDDATGHTLASASSLEASLRGAAGTKTERARKVGALVGERARAAGIERVVFDRAGFKYHGRIRSLADGAREAGLDF